MIRFVTTGFGGDGRRLLLRGADRVHLPIVGTIFCAILRIDHTIVRIVYAISRMANAILRLVYAILIYA